jgi:hypothetical protein
MSSLQPLKAEWITYRDKINDFDSNKRREYSNRISILNYNDRTLDLFGYIVKRGMQQDLEIRDRIITMEIIKLDDIVPPLPPPENTPI